MLYWCAWRDESKKFAWENIANFLARISGTHTCTLFQPFSYIYSTLSRWMFLSYKTSSKAHMSQIMHVSPPQIQRSDVGRVANKEHLKLYTVINHSKLQTMSILQFSFDDGIL